VDTQGLKGGSGLALAALVALAALAGCAPTTMGPMVMRLGPGHPDSTTLHGGIRSGPRLTAPIAARTTLDSTEANFSGNSSPFSTRQWSMAYDFALTKPLGESVAMHLGVQGEIYYPLPLPGYGLYGGVSSWFGSREVGVAPALVIRGASDFGIDTRGGPGSMFGAEASATLYFCPEPKVSLGLVPFFGVHQIYNRGESATALYYGGALVFQLPLGRVDRLELSGGFGRADVSGEASWNVPIMGTRWSR
jgi:hypothetical protein